MLIFSADNDLFKDVENSRPLVGYKQKYSDSRSCQVLAVFCVFRAQKKTTSVSLTIGSSTPKSGVTTAVIQPISVPSQQVFLGTNF